MVDEDNQMLSALNAHAELLNSIEAGREISGIPGVITRQGCGRPRPSVAILEELPFPARDLLPNDRYRYPLCGNRRMTTIISSRGCPYRCVFCDKGIFGNKWRARSADNVLAEIDEVFHKYEVRYLVFYDDLFVLNRNRLYEICEGLIRRGYPLRWKAEGRVDLVNAEMLAMMRRAGCDTIAYGVESANPSGLEYLGKHITPKQIIQAFRDTRKMGIKTMGYFILGIPCETYEDALRTIRFAIKLKTDYAQFSVLSPLPGTRLYEEAKANGWHREINAQNVNDKDFRRSVIISDNWTEEQLVSIVHQAHRLFYVRPKYVLKTLFRIRNWNELATLIRLGAMLFTYVFKREYMPSVPRKK